ncbi:MAG: hypothetical protein Q9217_006160 [Psora testacea]
MSWNAPPQFEQFSIAQGPSVSFQPDWNQLFNDPSLNKANNLSFSQPAGYQSFGQPVQSSNCVPFPHHTEHLRYGELAPLSNFPADLPSTEVWWLNQDIAPGHATMVPEDPLPQADLQGGSEEQIKNAVGPGKFQKLKQAMDALKDRCEALEKAVPKLQNDMEESNRNLLQLRDCLNGFMAWMVEFKNVTDGFVEDTRNRVESIELVQKDSKAVSGCSGH